VGPCTILKIESPPDLILDITVASVKLRVIIYSEPTCEIHQFTNFSLDQEAFFMISETETSSRCIFEVVAALVE